jgi:hypothetical protein
LKRIIDDVPDFLPNETVPLNIEDLHLRVSERAREELLSALKDYNEKSSIKLNFTVDPLGSCAIVESLFQMMEIT